MTTLAVFRPNCAVRSIVIWSTLFVAYLQRKLDLTSYLPWSAFACWRPLLISFCAPRYLFVLIRLCCTCSFPSLPQDYGLFRGRTLLVAGTVDLFSF